MVIFRIIQGITIGSIKVDTRSLDYGSFEAWAAWVSDVGMYGLGFRVLFPKPTWPSHAAPLKENGSNVQRAMFSISEGGRVELPKPQNRNPKQDPTVRVAMLHGSGSIDSIKSRYIIQKPQGIPAL